MTDNIVSFPGPANDVPRVWVCGCGCSTFEVYKAAPAPRLICANCEEEINDMGGWFAPPHDRPWAGDAPFSDVQGNGCVDFARRRVSAHVLHPETVMASVVWRDGSVSVWCDNDVVENVGWLKRRMIDMLEIVRRWAL